MESVPEIILAVAERHKCGEWNRKIEIMKNKLNFIFYSLSYSLIIALLNLLFMYWFDGPYQAYVYNLMEHWGFVLFYYIIIYGMYAPLAWWFTARLKNRHMGFFMPVLIVLPVACLLSPAIG